MISQAPLRYVIFSLSPRPKQMIPYHTVERKESRRRFSRTQEQVNSPIIFHICFFQPKSTQGQRACWGPGQIRSKDSPVRLLLLFHVRVGLHTTLALAVVRFISCSLLIEQKKLSALPRLFPAHAYAFRPFTLGSTVSVSSRSVLS